MINFSFRILVSLLTLIIPVNGFSSDQADKFNEEDSKPKNMPLVNRLAYAVPLESAVNEVTQGLITPQENDNRPELAAAAAILLGHDVRAIRALETAPFLDMRDFDSPSFTRTPLLPNMVLFREYLLPLPTVTTLHAYRNLKGHGFTQDLETAIKKEEIYKHSVKLSLNMALNREDFKFELREFVPENLIYELNLDTLPSEVLHLMCTGSPQAAKALLGVNKRLYQSAVETVVFTLKTPEDFSAYMEFPPQYRALPHLKVEFNVTWPHLRDLFLKNTSLKTLTANIDMKDPANKLKAYGGAPIAIIPGEPDLQVNWERSWGECIFYDGDKILRDLTHIKWDSRKPKSSIFPDQSEYYWYFLSKELYQK